jgi:uncharacterized membrane protein
MIMKRLHLVLYSASAAILASEIALTAYFWNILPATIPTHFNFAGNPDAWSGKSIGMVFLLPLIQLVLLCLFVALYKYPQYSSWPTTLILVTVEEKKREKIYDILRSMLAWTLLWLSLFMGYIQYAILATANGRANGVVNTVMFAMLGIMLLLIIIINVRMYRTVKKLI